MYGISTEVTIQILPLISSTVSSATKNSEHSGKEEPTAVAITA
jgi:hypothetical protein